MRVHEEGGEEAAGDRQSGKRLRIVADGQPHGQPRGGREQHECHRRRQDVVEPERGEHGEVQDARARPLQRQPVPRSVGLELDAQCDQYRAQQRNTRQAKLDRDGDVVREVLEQESHAEKQHDDADPRERVAACEPRPQRVGCRRWRWWRKCSSCRRAQSDVGCVGRWHEGRLGVLQTRQRGIGRLRLQRAIAALHPSLRQMRRFCGRHHRNVELCCARSTDRHTCGRRAGFSCPRLA